MKELINDIENLCVLDGVSGNEEKVREFIIEKLRSFETEISVTVDPLGNVIADVKGKEKAEKKVIFAAHMDEVGFIITDITEDGYLRFSSVGGIDPAVIFGSRIRVNGLLGIIGGQAIHQVSAENQKKIPEADTLLIDIGAENKEEAEKVVSLGDVATFDSDYMEVNSKYSDFVKAPAFDDRAGCGLLLELVRKMPPFDITVIFTVQEEVGLRGAMVAGHSTNPDIAVIIDATTASDVAGVPKEKHVCNVGSGTVVPFMDGRTLYDKELFDGTMKIAKDNNIKVQTKTTVAGGTDAGAIQISGSGVRVVGVSLPCRYLHSASSVLSKGDIKSTSDLLKLLAKKLPSVI